MSSIGVDNMQLDQPRPMLGVLDIHRTITFYGDALGYRVVDRLEVGGHLKWAALRNGDSELMFTHRGPETVNESGHAARRQVVLYFRPADVARLHKFVRAQGFKCSELRVTMYRMKEFDMADPDGYQLWFGQETEEAPTVREQ